MPMADVPTPGGDRKTSWLSRGVLASGILLIGAALLLMLLGLRRFKEHEEQQRRNALREKVSLACHAIEPVLREVRAGRMDRAAGIESARRIVHDLAYEDEYGPNAIFMSAMDGTVLVRSYGPQDELKNDLDSSTSRGAAIYWKVVPMLRAHPEGVFLAYPFPNPKTRVVDEKVSFFRLVPELDLAIGTGTHLDETVQAQVALLRNGLLLSTGLVVLCSLPMLALFRSLRRRNLALAQEALERGKAEEAIRQSEAKLATIFQASPDSIFIARLGYGRILELNPRFETVVGKPRDEIVGRTLDELGILVETHHMERLIGTVAAGGRVDSQEEVLVFPDGSRRNVLVSARRITFQGEPCGLFLARDISGWKAAQEVLRVSQQRLSLLVEQTPMGVIEWDLDFRVISWNPAAEGIFGYTREEALGRSGQELILPEGGEAVVEARWRELLHGQGGHHGTNANRRKDGRIIQCEWFNTPLADSEGRIIGIASLCLDITERVEGLEALRRSEERFQTIFHESPFMLILNELEGETYVDVNRHFCRFTGLARESVIGRTVTEVHVSGSSGLHDRMREQLASQGRIESQELFLEDASGRKCVALVSTRILDIGGKAHALTALQDITERRQAEEALRESERKSRAVVDLSFGFIWLLTPEGTLVETNLTALDAAGATQEQVAWKPVWETPWWCELRAEKEKLRAAVQAAAKGEVIRIEMNYRAVDQSIRCMDFSMKPLLDECDRVTLLISEGRDITERKRAEEALHDSEQRLRSIFEGAPIGMFEADLEGRITRMNAAHAAMFGYADIEDMTRNYQEKGSTTAMWDAPEDRAAYFARVVATKGRYCQQGARFRRKDGTVLHAIISMMLADDPVTGAPRIIGFIQDISDLKQAEEALLERERRLRILFEGSPIGAFRSTPEGKLIQANQALAAMFRYESPQALLDESGDLGFAQAVYHDDIGRRARILQRFAGRMGSWVVEEIHSRRRDGTFLDGIMTLSMSLDPLSGQPLLYGFVQDISERKRAETEIRHLEQYLSNIIDSMPSTLVGIDDAGTVTRWNLHAASATGVSAREAVGRPICDLLPEFSPWIETLRGEVASQGRPAAAEKILIEREGERRLYDLMMYPLAAEGMHGAVVRIEDVTERSRIQELMIQAEKMMSVGGLAAGMAHEINNPLAIITQAAQNIERRVSSGLPANRSVAEILGLDMELLNAYFEERQIRAFLDSIQVAVDRAAKIVDNLLKFSRGSDSVMRQACLTEVADRALELAANDYDLKKKFDFRNIEIRKDYEDALPPAPMDVIEIQQVILNLVKNAVQAMAAGPSPMPHRLFLRARREPRHVVLEVEDNGPGMSPEIQRRIFEPFFTTREPGEGTGLGLSVSYMIVAQHHKGLLEVESTPGQGTCFTLRLPLDTEYHHE